MPPAIFRLRYASPPWGDYGRILIHGMTSHLPRNDQGQLQLERTGPFVPPIFFPGLNVAVTAAARGRIEQSGLTGAVFAPMAMAHIVRLDWHKWDQSAERPPRLPFGGEPEGYILQGKHSPELAADIGPIFELTGRDRVRLVKCGAETRFGSDWSVFRPRSSAWQGDDIFGFERGSSLLLTERARSWFETEFGDLVRFEEERWTD